jgi:hypothetical protein
MNNHNTELFISQILLIVDYITKPYQRTGNILHTSQAGHWYSTVTQKLITRSQPSKSLFSFFLISIIFLFIWSCALVKANYHYQCHGTFAIYLVL